MSIERLSLVSTRTTASKKKLHNIFIFLRLIETCREKLVKMSDAAAEKPVGRPMKYPYTLSAKIAQFPYKFYYNNSWLYKYWGFSLLVTLPVIYKIHKAVNSPGNVAMWKEKERLEALEHHH